MPKGMLCESGRVEPRGKEWVILVQSIPLRHVPATTPASVRAAAWWRISLLPLAVQDCKLAGCWELAHLYVGRHVNTCKQVSVHAWVHMPVFVGGGGELMPSEPSTCH